jgi:hypothetical protein
MPCAADWDNLPIVELTSPESWQQVKNKSDMGIKPRLFSKEEIAAWCEQLGHLNPKAARISLLQSKLKHAPYHDGISRPDYHVCVHVT